MILKEVIIQQNNLLSMDFPTNVYLDTDMIYKLFDKFAEAVKHGKSLDNIELPEVVKFLKEVENKHRYFVSHITRAEIFRHLHSGQNLTKEECFVVWDFFLRFLQVTEILVKEVDFMEIADMLAQKPAKKTTIVNLEHLWTAKKNDLTVLTGDKPLKERFRIFYSKVIDYIDFRKLH